MNLLSKIGLFFGVILLSNYVVSLILRYIAQKTKAVHLRFTQSAMMSLRSTVWRSSLR